MSGQRLFGNSIAASCRHCEHVYQSLDDDRKLCDKKGIVQASSKCRNFIYDPLKRIPKKPKTLEKIESFEFELLDT